MARRRRTASDWARATAAWVAVATVSIVFWYYREALGVSWVTLVLLWLVVLYFDYRIGDIRDRVGLANLPSVEEYIAREVPIVPSHEEPTPPKPGSWSVLASTPSFFWDFASLADVLNDALRDTPWRLQSTKETDVGSLWMGDDSPVFGRHYRIFYGPGDIGTLSIRHGVDYSAATPEVSAEIEIVNARRINSFHLSELGQAIAWYLALDEAKSASAAIRAMRDSMIDCLWPIGPEIVLLEDLHWTTLGSAEAYLRRIKKSGA